jgi:hypothetical protein
MTVGIMQPYFFPYIGYFQLINIVDKWIVFDTPQYIRHGWINRNRILKPDGKDWQYINIPLKKHERDEVILNIEASVTEDWKSKIISQLDHYKKKAPHYYKTIEVVKESLQIPSSNIVDINISTMKNVCAYLDIKFNYEVYSKMNITHETPENAGEWALYISKAIGAKTYINPPGGRDIFEKEKYDEMGIDLKFIESKLLPYPQKNESFIAGLSIIDVMMFNSKDEIADHMKSFQLT